MLTKKRVNSLAFGIVGSIIEVHKELGTGLLESIYEEVLVHELRNEGFEVEQQKEIPVIYKGKKLNKTFRCDLLVENQIILELKSVVTLHPVFTAQILSYMRLAKKPKGLLVNFFVPNVTRDGISHYVNEYFERLPD